MSQSSPELEPAAVGHPMGSLQESRLQRLLEISATLSSTLDLKQLLNMVIDTVTDLTGAESASILLLDESTGKLYSAASAGPPNSEDGDDVPLEGSIAGWIVRHAEPLILEDLQAGGGPYIELQRPGGQEVRNLLGVPLMTKGRVIGALEAVNRIEGSDYTAQDVALLQVLASQAAVAIENARLFQQTDLIAELMHELKTPLMALTAASEILSREDMPPKQREVLAMIQRETARLSRMAQEFLDLARLESGRLSIARDPVDVRVLVNDVVALQETQAAARDITIHTDVPDGLPSVLGDFDRLTQVLLNLTSNAIKYNREGGSIAIKATVTPDTLVIEIADSGPGISSAHLSRLFERFYRVPDGEGFTEGTGLGLPIAKRILESHGGRIEVSSTPGKGSTFYCYLPLADN